MGDWHVLPYQSPILPVHAALLHTGKVLFVAGSGNDPDNVSDDTLRFGNAVLDRRTGTFTRPPIPDDVDGHPVDLFCCGHVFRANGHVIVAGGTVQYDPFFGQDCTLTFDPITEQWTTQPAMHNGRWYPTLVTLGSGRTFVGAGLGTNGQNNQQPEVFSFAFAGGWKAFPPTSGYPTYPQLVLLADGRLFFSGMNMGGSGLHPRVLTLPPVFARRITELPISGLSAASSNDQGATVLLPPAQDQKVMVMGGGANGTSTSRVAIIDFTRASPAYSDAPPLQYPRKHLSAVLLPDRTVFVCNGSHLHEDSTTSMLPAEIYNPEGNSWTTVEPPSVPRVYHSSAMLMPDGSVLTVGGNPARGVDELRLEVYRPSYMSLPRPVIDAAPVSTTYGASIAITTQQAAAIKWVSLIRPSASTHSCDTEQRVVDLPIATVNGATLSATVTGNRNLAPPGYYMLFVTDRDGVPSTAKWINLT